MAAGLLAFASATVLPGCVYQVGVPTAGAPSRTYLGLVKVSTPAQIGNAVKATALDVTVTGLKAERGVSLGYVREHIEEIPLDGTGIVVVRVKDDAQLQAAAKLLKPLNTQTIWIISEANR